MNVHACLAALHTDVENFTHPSGTVYTDTLLHDTQIIWMEVNGVVVVDGIMSWIN